MKILLVDPSFYSSGKLFKTKKLGYFPLTLARVAACFSKEHEITLIHERCQEIDFSKNYDLVGFSTMGSNWVRAAEISETFLSRGVKTVVGGFSAEKCLEACKDSFSSFVLGDAEELISEIIHDLEKNDLRKEYKNLSPSIENLPLPRFDLIPPSIVGDVVPVEASRGCPNSCAFCSITSLYSQNYRKRDVDEVLKEIELVLSVFKKRFIYFTDPNFTADMNHAKTILRKIQSEKLGGACEFTDFVSQALPTFGQEKAKGSHPRKFFWIAGVDINCLQDDEFLLLARKSGCLSLQIGFETLSKANLRAVGKNFAAEYDYPKLIKRAQNFGIPITALMMVGFDHDDRSTFKNIQRFVEEHHIPLLITHPVIPVPGTPMYKKLQLEGRLIHVDPKFADGLHVSFRPRNFTPAELENEFWRLNIQVSGIKSIFKRFLWTGILRNIPAYFVLFVMNFLLAKVAKKGLSIGDYNNSIK
ncbi:MAG: radical SAM protein [Candidatus Riflebacteria bacterium]|nr:radical SAM protein [Candidatus Riflebacteria bacterium]